MTKHLHQLLRERDERRAADEAASRAAAEVGAAGPGAGGGGGSAGGGGGGDGGRGDSGRGPDEGGRDRNPRGARLASSLAPLREPVVLAAMFFTFALGLFVGSRGDAAHASEEVVPADAPAATADELRRLDDVVAPGAARGLPADLLDPRNRFTIQVASYSNSLSAQRVAEEHVLFLAGAGYRVEGPLRVGRGEHLVVLVEAAREKTDLEALGAELRAIPNHQGSGPRFPDAYVREIDRLIER
jgi:hypothetical protein